jgi:hypothetical protein
MSLLDNAIKHFSESADHELHKVDVPEWDGAVWFKVVASMNGIAYQQYFKAATDASYESLVDVLILRARKEDGLKMFTRADKKKIMGAVSPEVVTRVVNEMSTADNQDTEEVKKS